jgi:hypothetical protein
MVSKDSFFASGRLLPHELGLLSRWPFYSASTQSLLSILSLGDWTSRCRAHSATRSRLLHSSNEGLIPFAALPTSDNPSGIPEKSNFAFLKLTVWLYTVNDLETNGPVHGDAVEFISGLVNKLSENTREIGRSTGT